MNKTVEYALFLTQKMRDDLPLVPTPPARVTSARTEFVLPFSLVKGSRGYIETVVHQINGCYEQGWYDGSAVMIRKLIEILIIEAFEFHGISEKIKNPKTGDFMYLSDLIELTLAEPKWNLGRNTRKALPKLKAVGDQSAHSRRYVAHRSDIEKIIPDLRVAVQELIYLSELG